MTSQPTRRERLDESAAACALYVRTYSPGDGITRYRFFTTPATSYFGPHNGIATVLGFKAAEQWVYAYRCGYFAAQRAASDFSGKGQQRLGTAPTEVQP